MRLRNWLTGITVVLCAMIAPAFGSPASVAAAPATAWQIKQGADPTILPPGTSNVAQYHVRVTNVGGKSASAGVTVSDTVTGATPVIGSGLLLGGPNAAFPSRGTEKNLFPCAITGQTVSCEIKNRVVGPDEQFDVLIPVEIGASPPEIVTNKVIVSSPGAVSASSALSSRTGGESPPSPS